jgi:hypothetical protein
MILRGSNEAQSLGRIQIFALTLWGVEGKFLRPIHRLLQPAGTGGCDSLAYSV